jgi:hypothetical protein
MEGTDDLRAALNQMRGTATTLCDLMAEAPFNAIFAILAKMHLDNAFALLDAAIPSTMTAFPVGDIVQAKAPPGMELPEFLRSAPTFSGDAKGSLPAACGESADPAKRSVQ